MLRTVRYPSSRVHHAALLEDEESIQVALMETINALLRGTIEIKRAELILRALNTAVRNIRRVHFGLHPDAWSKRSPTTPPHRSNKSTNNTPTNSAAKRSVPKPPAPQR